MKYHRIDEGIFFRIRRLAWYIDPESYAGGSVATCRATLADRSKESTQTKRDTLVLQVGGWVVGPAPHHPVKTHMLKNPDKGLEKRTVYLINDMKLEKLMNYGTWNVQDVRGKMEEITSEVGKLKRM